MQLDTFALINDKVCCKLNKTVIHWGLFTVGGRNEPWVIAPDDMSASEYVRRHLLNKERFHLWD